MAGEARTDRRQIDPGELPILFSGPMVRALLAGKKTQTRRLAKWTPLGGASLDFSGLEAGHYCTGVPSSGWVLRSRGPGACWNDRTKRLFCPYGQPGDRLWVRETWARRLDEDHLGAAGLPGDWAWYWADPQTCNTGCAGAAGKKRPAIHMPRWASRLTLEVTRVRVQRVQEISEEDARAEGHSVESFPVRINGQRGQVAIFDPRKWFATLWDAINGKRAPWATNPWVWAVTFEVADARR